MKFKPVLRLAALCSLLFCQLVLADTLPYYKSADFTPYWSPTPHELSRWHQIPEFTFTDQHGAQITDESITGKLYVASFFFSSCPGICPAIKSKLEAVQTAFSEQDNLFILSHSIRPTVDTPAILKGYAAKHNIVSSRWHLLTGDRDYMYEIAKSAYFASEDLGETTGASQFLHTENLLLIDQNRHIRGVYNGLSTSSVEHLIHDIELLLSSS